ncbi:MAG: hypothetical protein KAW12_01540 [Candidatus Aminicenantes bacterium]|nr:hypothetical protein [Candidatus Aminicenantes bacterium]
MNKKKTGSIKVLWGNFLRIKVGNWDRRTASSALGQFFKNAPWSPKASLFKVFLLIFLISVCLPAGTEKSVKEMSYEEAVKKYRELNDVRKFLETETPALYPWSMNEFFDSAIYEKLQGNEFFGYYHNEGVRYVGNRIAIDTISVIKGRGYEKYKDKFALIFLETLRAGKKQVYVIDKGCRYSIGICLVSVKEKDDEEGVKGVVLECYVKDRKTGKRFFHRCGTGSVGELEQSMRLSAVRIVCNLQYLKRNK